MLTFFVNHVLKFKFLMKRMSYAKVDCSHLNPDAKRLIQCREVNVLRKCELVRTIFFFATSMQND